MSREKTAPALDLVTILLAALSLSIGWGVRGNWGHEYGAMIPGGLSAIVVALLSGREDWRRRVVYFAFFGALGWSFGGSMSYGIVIGYTHSDHGPSVLYGFACLFAIGFLWGAIGGAGTALPAFLNRDRLTEFFLPLCAVFAAWALQDLVLYTGLLDESRLDWYDTDWVAALLAIVAVLVLSLVRWRFCRASSLILQMAIGWWMGFLVLVVWFGLRMTPPRSDNWAGSTGMTIAMLIYLFRNRLAPVAFVSIVAGFFAGFGFSTANMIKLMGVATGWAVNWHSVMEQTFGFISGVGVALGMAYLSTRAPRVNEEPYVRGWTGPFAVGFTLLLITFVNIRKNVWAVWLPNKVVQESMYGISAVGWFNMAYLAVAVVAILLLVRHQRSPLSIVPDTWLGRGQVFYLLFLWWIVIGNLSRYLPFHPGRLVTEGVIHLNACLCTALILFCPSENQAVPEYPVPNYPRQILRVMRKGFVVLVVSVAIQMVVVLKLFDEPSGRLQIRFGPNATHLER